MTAQRLKFAAVRHLPEFNRLIVAAGREQRPVRTETHAFDRAGMTAQRAEFCAVSSLPQFNRLIVAARREQRPVRAETHALHPAGMTAQRADFAAVSHIPQLDRHIRAGRSERLAVRAETQTVDESDKSSHDIMAVQCPNFRSIRDVPQCNHAVLAASRHDRSIRADTDAGRSPQAAERANLGAVSDVPERQPVGNCRAVWAKSNAWHLNVRIFGEHADLLAGGDIPHSERLVFAARS